MLLTSLATLLSGWLPAFSAEKTHLRVTGILVALACTMSRRRTVTEAIRYRGNDARWSSDYRVFSRAKWEVSRTLEPPGETRPLGLVFTTFTIK